MKKILLIFAFFCAFVYAKAQIQTLEGHKGYVYEARFSPDGKTLISVGSDKTIKLWNVENGKLLHTFEGHKDPVLSVDFSPDGKTFVSSTANTLKIWSVKKKKEIKPFIYDYVGASKVRFSPDGTLLLISTKNKMQMWNIEKRSPITYFKLQTYRGEIYSACFSNSDYIFTCGTDYKITKWYVRDEKPVYETPKQTWEVMSVCFNPNKEELLATGYDGKLKKWNTKNNQVIYTFPEKMGNNEKVSISSDGKMALTAGDEKMIRLWDVEKGKLIGVVSASTAFAHTNSITSFGFSPDGTKVFSTGGWDTTIKIWEINPTTLEKYKQNIPKLQEQQNITAEKQKEEVRAAEVIRQAENDLIVKKKQEEFRLAEIKREEDERLAPERARQKAKEDARLAEEKIKQEAVGNDFPVLLKSESSPYSLFAQGYKYDISYKGKTFYLYGLVGGTKIYDTQSDRDFYSTPTINTEFEKCIRLIYTVGNSYIGLNTIKDGQMLVEFEHKYKARPRNYGSSRGELDSVENNDVIIETFEELFKNEKTRKLLWGI
jgi:uncharacterized protein with WD repeat